MNINCFLKKKKSLHLYPKTKRSFRNVFKKIPKSEFESLIDGLELLVIHEGAIAQVMHYSNTSVKKVLQMPVPHDIPSEVLEYVIAHELGHVAQNRNWRESDGSSLEVDADRRAEVWGFKRTKFVDNWIKIYGKNLQVGDCEY